MLENCVALTSMHVALDVNVFCTRFVAFLYVSIWITKQQRNGFLQVYRFKIYLYTKKKKSQEGQLRTSGFKATMISISFKSDP